MARACSQLGPDFLCDSRRIHLALLARGHVAKGRRAIAQEDQRELRPDAIGLLHLALGAAPGEVEIGRHPAAPQLRDQRERAGALIVARDDEDTVAGRLCPLARLALLLVRESHATHPESPTATRRRLAAQLLDQSVVAAPSSNPRLRA